MRKIADDQDTLSDEQIEQFKKIITESDCLSNARLRVELPCGCRVDSDADREKHECKPMIRIDFSEI